MPLPEDHTRPICRVDQLEASQCIARFDGQAIRQASRETEDWEYTQEIIQERQPNEWPPAKQRLMRTRVSPAVEFADAKGQRPLDRVVFTGSGDDKGGTYVKGLGYAGEDTFFRKNALLLVVRDAHPSRLRICGRELPKQRIIDRHFGRQRYVGTNYTTQPTPHLNVHLRRYVFRNFFQ